MVRLLPETHVLLVLILILRRLLLQVQVEQDHRQQKESVEDERVEHAAFSISRGVFALLVLTLVVLRRLFLRG